MRNLLESIDEKLPNQLWQLDRQLDNGLSYGLCCKLTISLNQFYDEFYNNFVNQLLRDQYLKAKKMKQFINKVTITGADDSVKPSDLLALSKKFEFVEWGILLSKSKESYARFPSYSWINELKTLWDESWENEHNPLCLSGHICGSWVRDICKGNWAFLTDCLEFEEMFSRFQLNFHAYVHHLNAVDFIKGFEDERLWLRQFIFQLDNVNNSILEIAKSHEIDAVGLFDLSGGAGILPEIWPEPNGYSGYAGGLSPENLPGQLTLIENVIGDATIWIDVETHVRSNNDQQFDLEQVEKFLEIAQPYILPQVPKKRPYQLKENR